MKFLKLILSLSIAALVSFGARAEETIFFRINNSDIDSGFKDNSEVLHNLEAILSARTPVQVRIHGAASPDGPTALNTRLAKERAQAAVAIIKSLCPQVADTAFVVSTTAEDIDGTIYYIGKSNQEWADEAIRILSRAVSNPEEGLRHIHDGKIWRYLADEVFPLLRKTDIEFVFDSEASTPVVVGGESATEEPEAKISKPSDAKSMGLPWWAIVTMGLLGAGTVTFGALYAREHRKNKVLADTVPEVIAGPVAPVTQPEPEPVLEPEPEPVPEPEVVSGPAPVLEPEPQPFQEPVIAHEPIPEPVPEPAPVPEQFVTPIPVVDAQPSYFAQKVYGLIDENISNPDFGVEQLAEAMGMSRIHLNRKLKAESIASPSALLKEARMKLASQLIHENSLSMSEISAKCGFATPSYFSTAFKDFYGVTPSEYK